MYNNFLVLFAFPTVYKCGSAKQVDECRPRFCSGIYKYRQDKTETQIQTRQDRDTERKQYRDNERQIEKEIRGKDPDKQENEERRRTGQKR